MKQLYHRSVYVQDAFEYSTKIITCSDNYIYIYAVNYYIGNFTCIHVSVLLRVFH